MDIGLFVTDDPALILNPVANETWIFNKTTGQLSVFNGSGYTVITGQTGNVSQGPITTSGLTQATGKLLGRSSASSGAIEEITAGSGLSLSGGILSATATSSHESYPVADIQVARGVVTHVGADFTTGVIFANVSPVTLVGFKFGYDGFASKTVKWTLYDNGYDGTGSTVVETSTVAVSAAQVYAITLAVPLALAQGKIYTIAIYINDGSNIINYTSYLSPWSNAVLGGGNVLQSRVYVGPIVWLDIAAAAAGDAKPVQASGTNAAPIQLTYQ